MESDGLDPLILNFGTVWEPRLNILLNLKNCMESFLHIHMSSCEC